MFKSGDKVRFKKDWRITAFKKGDRTNSMFDNDKWGFFCIPDKAIDIWEKQGVLTVFDTLTTELESTEGIMIKVRHIASCYIYPAEWFELAE